MIWIPAFFAVALCTPVAIDYQQFLNEVNARRTGLAPLKLSDQLNKSAQSHSNYNAQINSLTHDDPAGNPIERQKVFGYSPGSSAENIAQTFANNLKEAADLIANDPPHLENIVGPYTDVGFGCAMVGGKYYWTQHFAAPLGGGGGGSRPAGGAPAAAPAAGAPATPAAAPAAAPVAPAPAAPAPPPPQGPSLQQQIDSVLKPMQNPADPAIVVISPTPLNTPQPKSFGMPPPLPCVGGECAAALNMPIAYPTMPRPQPIGYDTFGQPIFR